MPTRPTTNETEITEQKNKHKTDIKAQNHNIGK